MSKALVIVESPAKAKTISKYLGKDYEVESSIGHVRDLPASAAEIPARYKDQSWARLGVNVDGDFEPVYIVPKGKKAQVTKLRNMLKNSTELLLATDEDREGEAIAWHLQEVLKPKVPVRRMVFGEITKGAIAKAVESTRGINEDLVRAQEARRILDRLYGYEVSPILWRKVKPKLSAGRVQSVATRLVVERERQRIRFVAADYWGMEAELEPVETGGEGVPDGTPRSVQARLAEVGGKPIARGKDFDEETGKLKKPDNVRRLDTEAAQGLLESLSGARFKVAEVEEKPFTNRPYAPFITSTLQQEAGRKLRFTAQRAMRVAQGLYENGYITYMRTDSTNLSSEAMAAARSQIANLYGQNFLPDSPRVYPTKSKNAQEAHEAIRPAGDTFRTPESVKAELGDDAYRLYELIWKRTMASQMKDAKGLRTRVRFAADGGDHGEAIFAASGKVIQFPGFLRAYVEGSDDPNARLADQEAILPPLSRGQTLDARSLSPTEHSTQPPARFTEASLVKELEERGIGRPSTYATILETIQDRGYVWKKGTALVPTFTAFAVTNLLEQHLTGLVEIDFTARMEDDLDSIASGGREAQQWLHDFYFGRGVEASAGAAGGTQRVTDVGLKGMVGISGDEIDARAVCSLPLGRNSKGEELEARVGRFGPYLENAATLERATLPDGLAPDELTVEKAEEIFAAAAEGDRVLGEDPETGKPIYLKTGRFGPYVQLGDAETANKGAKGAKGAKKSTKKKGPKPKMASLWKGMEPGSVTFEDALMLLSFPKSLGAHPESGEEITVQDGRYGPYLKMGKDSRSLKDHQQMASVTLEEAVEIYKQPKTRGRTASAVLKEVGEHPDTKLPLVVKTGRFGPYVTDGVVNATVPKGKDPAAVDLDAAVELIAAREEKMRDQGKDPRAPKKRRARK